MTVTAPGSWQAPPLPRQQHLLPRRTRFSRGTYLVKCAPGLSCIETFSSSCTRKGLPRKQLANSLSRRADGSINKAQASSSSPSPIPPCLPPPFHLPKARSRRAEQQQQVQKVRGRRERRGLAAAIKPVLDLEQRTGSKLGKEYIKDVYCHLAYLTYMQSTTCKMLDWIKHKLISRLQGELSITSNRQMTSPLWQKAKRN